MKTRTFKPLLVAVLCLVVSSIVNADTYSTFQTKRFYSANADYFVEIKPDRRATLYRVRPRTEQIWSQILEKLPQSVFLTNDGTRVVMVENYYGNGGSASAKVIVFFDEDGKQIAAHTLQEVAALSRLFRTISSAHWYRGGLFTADQATFIVETFVRKCDPPKPNPQTEEEIKEMWDCMKPDPHEELRFSTASGALVSRTSIREKYLDREKLLLSDLEFVLEEHPTDDLSLAHATLSLGRFYEEQKQYARATDFYDQAIQSFNRALGPDSHQTAEALGDAAGNQRKSGDYRRAEQLYRQTLNALDKNQGRPGSVYPIAIVYYEAYASLLRERNRVREAEKLESRARVLRGVYPNYKRN